MPVRLPSYSPELNPIERLWQALKFELQSWYPHMEQLRGDMEQWLEQLQPERVRSLTYFPYIRELMEEHYVL